MGYQPPRNGFRTFVILWASQAASVFGTDLTLFALNIWLVQVIYPLPEQQPELAWALAALGLVMAVTGILATPIAGALVDRLDRKRVMLAMDLVNGVAMTTTAVLAATGILQVWMMLLISGLFGITDAVHSAALDTSYAMLVSDEQLPRANGMMQSLWSLSAVLSPAAAAGLVALPGLARQGLIPGGLGQFLAGLKNGVPLAFSLDAITFFLSAAVLLFLQIPSPQHQQIGRLGRAVASIWSDIRFGVDYVRRRPPLLWLLATFAVANLCEPMGVFLPLVVKVDLAADWLARGFTYETALATLNTMMAVGGLVGAVLVSLWGGARRRRVAALLFFMLLGGVTQIGLGLLPALYLAGAAAFFKSFTIPMANAHSQAIWQGQVPREMQGRVFAVRRVIAQGLMPLGQVLAGWLAASMDPGMGLALLGVLIVITNLGQLLNRQLMQLEHMK